jgi:hypothetical protein
MTTARAVLAGGSAAMQRLRHGKEQTMTGRLKVAAPIAAVLLAAGLAACAPQPSTPATAAAAPAVPPAAAGPTPAAAPANHQEMMAHCAEMWRQASGGAQVTADMQRMLTYCRHMDHAMGAQRGRSGP